MPSLALCYHTGVMLSEIIKNSTVILSLAGAASAAAVIIGLIVAWGQLHALNKASQLQNFISLAQEADTQEFSESYAAVRQLSALTLADKLRVADTGEAEHIDRVTNYFERIAVLVRRKYLDKSLAINWWGVLAKDAYDSIEDWIAHYQQADPGACSEFQWFVSAAESHWLRCGRVRQTQRIGVSAASLRSRRTR